MEKKNGSITLTSLREHEKEKFIIVEKVVYGKTDNEIAVELGVSRQAITNTRKRLSDKFYKNKKL